MLQLNLVCIALGAEVIFFGQFRSDLQSDPGPPDLFHPDLKLNPGPPGRQVGVLATMLLHPQVRPCSTPLRVLDIWG